MTPSIVTALGVPTGIPVGPGLNVPPPEGGIAVGADDGGTDDGGADDGGALAVGCSVGPEPG
jgi:hypothetical protein